MRSIVAILAVIFSSPPLFADGQVLKGKIVSVADPIVGHTSIRSRYCHHPQDEHHLCTGLIFEGVSLQSSDGHITLIDRLVMPAESSGGLMGMSSADDILFITMALVPRSSLKDDYKQFINSVELEEVSCVLIDNDKVTIQPGKHKIALGQAELVVQLSDQGRKTYVIDLQVRGQDVNEDQKKGVIRRNFGGYLDLQKIANEN